VTKADKVLSALGDATRRDMVERLTDTAMSVSALAQPYDMTLTAVAQHIAILEGSCRLDTKGFDILDAWSKARRPLWQRRLDILGDILDED
jgi:DNA-binding transcriptional ArsR family regulator